MVRRFIWSLIAMLVVLLVTIGILLLTRETNYRGVLYDPPQAAFDFQLYTAGNEPVSLKDLNGKAVLLFFGYTSCPDICPNTLAILRQVYTDLGEQADKVQVIYITVDPERDTPQRVADYAAIFHPDFIGLSGGLEALEAAWAAYGVYREIDDTSGSSAGYLVTHSARLYLIDPQGDLLLSYSYGTPAEDILYDVRLLLREYE